MSPLDKSKLRLVTNEETDEDGSEGQAGQIEFTDFLSSVDQKRDDLLSPEEKKRLQVVHDDIHKALVKKQKELRTERQAAKDNRKFSQATNQQGYTGVGGGEPSSFKPNPVLDCAQFSGSTDKKVSPAATKYQADTNQEQRAEAEHQYRLQNQPSFTPKPGFNPRPLPR